MAAEKVQADIDSSRGNVEELEMKERVQSLLYTTPQLDRGLSGVLSPSFPGSSLARISHWEAYQLVDAPRALSSPVGRQSRAHEGDDTAGKGVFRLDW